MCGRRLAPKSSCHHGHSSQMELIIDKSNGLASQSQKLLSRFFYLVPSSIQVTNVTHLQNSQEYYSNHIIVIAIGLVWVK